MSTFSPDRGLSVAASALAAEDLEDEVLVAEEVLGLSGWTFTGDAERRAKKAVARQVNLQVRIANGGDVIAESKGHQSVTYANSGGQRIPVDAIAKRVADRLTRRKPRTTTTEGHATW